MKGREALERLSAQLKASFARYRLVWLVILAGLVLMAIPLGGGEEPVEAPEAEPLQFDISAMEARLSEALSRIEGAGKVTVLLTLEDGPRRVLAQDVERETGQGEKVETVVLSRNSSSQETVVIQELYPDYQGALLICPGGEDPHVRLQLTEATSALTGLGADRISISKGK